MGGAAGRRALAPGAARAGRGLPGAALQARLSATRLGLPKHRQVRGPRMLARQTSLSARWAHAATHCAHLHASDGRLDTPPLSPPEQKRPLHGKTCRVSGHGFMSQQEGRAGRSVDLRALRAATSASRPAASWPSMRPRRRPTARAARRAACWSARWACRPRIA